MNPEDFKHLNMTFTIVPTVRNGRYIIKDSYKYTSYTEQGRPVIPEPEITDCSEALAVIAKIKGGL